MQHIGLEIIDERGNMITRSSINFALVISALWKIQDRENLFPFLSGVDPYGHTYFNVHQAPKIIEELEKLEHADEASTATKEIKDTMEFLKKVEQHTFAKFIGD
jgi:hypothetical protein